MVNANENDVKKWKIDHIDTTLGLDLGLDIDTNILNLKCVRYNDVYV